jgi:hypothetical protein
MVCYYWWHQVNSAVYDYHSNWAKRSRYNLSLMAVVRPLGLIPVSIQPKKCSALPSIYLYECLTF